MLVEGRKNISIYQRMKNEYQRLGQQLDELRAQLEGLPEGKLICARNEGRIKWYHSDGKTKTYIAKQNRVLAEQLAIRKYLAQQFQNISQERHSIAYYLRHHDADVKPADEILAASEYQELLAPYFTPVSQELSDWMYAPYERNQKNPEQLTQKACSGNMVRSKSEAIIDMLLFINKIPFRYECELQLEETSLYPDFTLRHPQTGQIFYWEHFGMMDNPSYCRNVSAKLNLYFSHGIIPTVNLITTYETKDNPLNIEIVEGMIEHYFL